MADQEMPEELAGQPVISFATVPDCEAWFAEHHANHRGFRLQIGKVGAAETVSYAQALIKAGRMRPAGQAQVDAAKAGGRRPVPARRARPSPMTWPPHSRPT
ncbi:hypothetical protein [Leekyejoonella antrihumi]|uniref:hypothetical protein n=1 Tax=Leekyejoonella antrihumi TaxID=1660198 RepID=UPI001FEA3853|nr:hypothetical protein [Leekyejoonella antrihumi]